MCPLSPNSGSSNNNGCTSTSISNRRDSGRDRERGSNMQMMYLGRRVILFFLIYFSSCFFLQIHILHIGDV
jgi:hypothetical protein